MTAAAIKMLQKEKKGFVLFVEGGKIDLGHHANMAKKALDETLEVNYFKIYKLLNTSYNYKFTVFKSSSNGLRND